VHEHYTDYIREHILEPLGMTHTTFEPREAASRQLAKGYVLVKTGAESSTADDELRNGRGYKVPNGGLFSTVKDLARFLSLEMGYGPEEVISKPVLDSIYSHAYFADTGLTFGCGLGFMVYRRGDDCGSRKARSD